MTLTATTIAVLILATYRTTRVFTEDELSAGWRAKVYTWAYIDVAPEPPYPRQSAWRTWFYMLISCPVCLGVWCAATLWAIWRCGGDVGHALNYVLAAAGGQNFLQTRSEHV